MNYCIHLKKRKNKPFCKLLDKEITLSECNSINAENKCREYKTKNKDNSSYKNKNVTVFSKNSAKKSTLVKKRAVKTENKTQHNKKMRVKSNKLAKLERNRFSVFTDNKDKCMFCPATTNLTWHEIFAGRNRQNSMEDGLCLRMCLLCHEIKQEDTQFNEFWHHEAQLYYESHIGSRKQFLDRYRRNYLE